MKTPFARKFIGRPVRGIGPLEAQLWTIGEAPGADEERTREPFTGATGRMLMDIWGELGIDRENVRIENTAELRPPENQLWRFSDSVLHRYQDSLHRRIAAAPAPNVINPQGNFTLNTLMRVPYRRDKRKRLQFQEKITQHAGHIGTYTDLNGRKLKMIASIHPATLFRKPTWSERLYRDWARIAEDMLFPQRRLDKAEHLIAPSADDVVEFVEEVEACQDPKAFLTGDVETPGGYVGCMSFTLDGRHSITIGTRPEHWGGNPRMVRFAWAMIGRLLRSKIKKGFWFGCFDRYILKKRHGVTVVNPWWDGHDLSHLLNAGDEHNLAYNASYRLRVAYWKDEAKESESGGGYKREFTRDWRKLHTYCGKDSCNTHRIILQQINEMREQGLERVYHEQKRRLNNACLAMSLKGQRVDQRMQMAIHSAQVAKMATIAAKLERFAGQPMRGKGGGLSSPKVVWLFYTKLKCKPTFNRDTGQLTADEVTIRKHMNRHPEAVRPGRYVLKYRRREKLKQFTEPKRLDPDGRFRSSYKITPKNCRLASSKNPTRTGGNGQNQDREVRQMFIADRGQLLLELDESQAENRLVDGMSGDRDLLEEARASPLTYDTHRVNAGLIFGVDPKKVTEQQRDLGKRTRHAVNYGMKGVRMSEIVLKETEGRLVLDPSECQEWINTLLKKRPGIVKYHKWIEDLILEQGYLQNSWGRRLYFRMWRLDDHFIKEGFSWPPSSEVACLLNQRGFIPTTKYIRANSMKAAVVYQGHDSMMTTASLEDSWKLAVKATNWLSAERTYPGRKGAWKLSMPIGVKLGFRWGKGMTEWKALPTKDEFMAAGERHLKEAREVDRPTKADRLRRAA